LSHLSGGTLLKEDGAIVQHFRWHSPKLFSLSVTPATYIAIDDNSLETVLFLSHGIPGSDGRKSLGFTARSDKEIPCLGHGWRRVDVSDHSLNDAAARVLGLVPEEPRKITQTDFLARSSANDLLLAIRIDFQGTSDEREPVTGGYWHFLKMPRVHENPKEKGFRY
jgi:hypothetical protein